MKRILSILLTAVVAVSMFSITTTAGAVYKAKTSGSWKYFIAGGKAEITEYLGKAKVVSIPSKLGGKKVTVIGVRAFHNNKNITTVRVPKTVRRIERAAFSECCNLKKVRLENGLKTIEQYAFRDCRSLVAIKIPDSVTAIGYGLFEWCGKLEIVKLSNNIKKLPGNTFFMTAVKTVRVPENCVVLCNGAFGYSKVQTVVIGGKKTRAVRDYAFEGASSLKTIKVSQDNKYLSSENGVLYNKDKTELLAYPRMKSGSEFTVPSTVKTINSNAFYDSRLKKITLPEGLKTIEGLAFYNMKKLVKINIPDTVEEIDRLAFSYCESLSSISIPSSVKRIGRFAFIRAGLEKIEIDPNPELVLDGYAFARNNNLTEVTLFPVKKSCGHTFYCCESLEKVNIPENVTAVYEEDFYGCEKLKNVYIPLSVEEIGERAFGYTEEFIDEDYYDDYVYIPIEGFKILGKSGTAAHQYALDNDIDFEDIE